ncbi:MAG: SoxR reducing system RseC family protein [Pseudomonadota bacterium]
MLTETGRVVGLDGETVWVETLRQSTCGACSARSGCGHGLLNSALPGGSRALVKARLHGDLRQPISLQDYVEVALPERSFLTAAAALYLLPLITAVLAALLAEAFWSGAGASLDAAVALASLLGLGAGLGVVHWLSRRQLATGSYIPLVTARIASQRD